MAKDNNKKSFTLRKLSKDVTRLNKLSKDLLDSASNSDTTRRDDTLNRYMDDVNEIVNNDFKRMTAYSSDDLSSFLLDFFKKSSDGSDGFNINSLEDVFENDSSGLLQQFQGKFQSELMVLEDLEAVTSQFHELQEAIEIFRDSILSADENSNTISRELLFQTKNAGDESVSYQHTAEAVEKEHKLLKKLKSHIVPNTLKFGKYYVYTVPYEHIYTKFATKKNQDSVKESSGELSYEPVTESFVNDFMESNDIDVKKMNRVQKKKAIDVANEFLSSVSVINDDLSLPVMENSQEVAALLEMELSKSTKKSKKTSVTTDGVLDVDAGQNNGKMDADFSNINGCYVKLIDPRKMIPVRVLEQTLGYYYIHEEPTTKNRSPFSSNFKIDLTKGYSKKEDDFIDRISEKIVKSFNKPFLEKNIKFKKSIAAAIIHNDIYKKNIKFQFIPAEHITEFKVNEDENDEGRSVLLGSLFYAKLYLALLLFNMITILSKSNDQRLYYISSSGIDKNIANKVQSAARQIKAREMNYSDLFNYKSMVSKVGSGRDAYIPTGPDDRRAIGFDILAGQNVELYSELMTMLKTSALNSTGVPAVIMNYINEADYAKSIVMGNLRFLGRTVSLQVDFNDAATELYKKIFKYSSTLSEEVIAGFTFKLARPRTLDANNLVELTNNADALAKFMANSIMGENSDMTDLDNMTKDLAVKKYLKELTSMLGWTEFEEIFEDARVEAVKIVAERKAQEETA